MDDLISRQAALDVLNELARDRFTIKDTFQIYLDALKDADLKIRQIPTAEPELIRCKDCKFYKGLAVCMIHEEKCGGTNYFCAWAERRTDG